MTKFFEGKNILLISPEAWDHLFVSKHHYALELSKNNKVYFLNPPSGEFSIIKSEYKNLWVVNYSSFVMGLRFLPRLLQGHFIAKKFCQIQKLTSTQFDCIWSFDNSVFFDFSFLPKRILKISHIVDFSQNFQSSKAASTADICFGLSQNIVDRLRNSNKESYLIPHGITLNRTDPMDVHLPGVNSIKALYAGNLDIEYLDLQTMYKIIDDCPQVDFVFLGSGGTSWRKYSNTFFLGAINREQLLSYLAKADVLLTFYDFEKFPNQVTNSHKILEYLSTGKVVVSNFFSDYENKPLLIQMAKEKNELPVLFKKIISNLSFYNNELNARKRREFAIKNTYTIRLMEIEKLIKEKSLIDL